jgi:hypothetical protein
MSPTRASPELGSYGFYLEASATRLGTAPRLGRAELAWGPSVYTLKRGDSETRNETTVKNMVDFIIIINAIGIARNQPTFNNAWQPNTLHRYLYIYIRPACKLTSQGVQSRIIELLKHVQVRGLPEPKNPHPANVPSGQSCVHCSSLVHIPPSLTSFGILGSSA